MRRHVIGAVCAMVVLAANGTAEPAQTEVDPKRWTKEAMWSRCAAVLVPANEVRLGSDEYGRVWDFSKEDRGNFTFFDAVTDVHVTEQGALGFTLTEETATLGWGNFGGHQPREDRVRFWPRFNVRFTVRQSEDAQTTLRIRFWSQGQRDAARGTSYARGEHIKTLTGTDWTDLTFHTWLEPPLRDGFDLEIEGPAGSTLEIKDLAITRYDNQGYLRKEIAVPEGDVWRALVEVGSIDQLSVNGEVVKPARVPGGGGLGAYGSEVVDLRGFLEPGKSNCVALYGRRAGESPGMVPYIAMLGSVVMDSGERIPLDADTSWAWSPKPAEGWTEPGFDDSDWRRVKAEGATPADAVIQAGWRLSYRPSRLPVYDGLIRLLNPDDAQLYYTESEPVICWVEVPRGLSREAPGVTWSVSRYAPEAFKEVASGTAPPGRVEGRSLRYTINAGHLDRGVYLLTTALVADGEVLEERPPEALVVTGRLPMPVTQGETYTDGMDLGLERVIDLTDPGDGPWTEAAGDPAEEPSMDPNAGIQTATVVTRNGLTYRETQPSYRAVLSYLVQFEHPGDFYLMELDYPNDRARMMGVACSAATWGLTAGHSKSSATVVTGGRYPLSGEMQTLRWLYRPDPGNHSLNLVNIKQGVPAAAAALRIYHIENGLPALHATQTHTRYNGLMTERTKADPGRFSITEQPPSEVKLAHRQEDAPLVLNQCKKLAYYLDGCEAFARYMRFAGQNVHIMGTFHASPLNTPPAVFDWPFPCARVKGGIRDILGRVLRDNGIDFYAYVEFIYTPALVELGQELSGRPASGFWDTPYLVDPNGKAYTAWDGRYGFNFNHPKVREILLATAEDIGRKYRTLSNFKGVVWNTFIGEWLPTYRGRLHRREPWTRDEFTHYGYGDVTIREFEQDTGVEVPLPLDNPERFRLRHAYLNAEPMRETWVAWRAERMHGFFHEVAETLHEQRVDLVCIADLYLPPRYDLEWRQSGLSFRDYMRANAWDGSLFAEDDTVCLATTLWGVLNRVDRGYGNRPGVGWDQSSVPERYAFFEAEINRAVEIKHKWNEAEKISWNLPYREDWPRQHQLTLAYQPDGDHTREVFVRALIELDPDLFFYGFSDATLFEGNEQPLREFNQILRALPSEKFRPVDNTGLNTNLAIRELTQDGAFWFYVANPGYWPVHGEIVLEHGNEVIDAISGEVVSKPGPDGRATVEVALDPFGVAAYQAPAPEPEARIVEWAARVQECVGTEHLAHMMEDTRALLETPAVRVVLPPEDETFVLETLTAAQQAMESGEYAEALFLVSSDRFWLLKNVYMEKAATLGTETERRGQVSTARRNAVSHEVDEPPIVDGALDDAIWKSTAEYSEFVCSDGMPAIAKTAFQVVHHDESIYLAVRCEDRYPDRVKAEAKSERQVLKDDFIAMFIQPDLEEDVYYQLAVSASAVRFDQEVKAGAKEYAAFAPEWEAKTAITEDGWVAEVQLPADAVGGVLREAGSWGFNIHRAFREMEAPPSSWSYTPGSWHNVARLGRLEFRRRRAGVEP